MTQKELDKIIENHKHWLNQDCDGWEKMRADLSYKDLKGLDLSYANLSCADLSCADLSYANLSCADLSSTNLRCAVLRCEDLSYADLSCAELGIAKNIPFIPLACPSEGAFIGWKKADGYIVKLQIPKSAKRLSATSRKCRCDKAKVLEIQNLDGTKSKLTSVSSSWDENFIYTVGKTVKVENFDENRWNECSTGIHFFIDREEAVKY